MDMGSRISIMLPPHWKLIARDGYNGMILWTKDIPDWQDHMWPLKSGPTQLTRRIVAVDDKVYVTLGRATHITCLSAFDGSVVREFPATKACEEILVEGRQMLALVRHGDTDERSDFKPSQGDQGRANNGFLYKAEGRMWLTEYPSSALSKAESVYPPPVLASMEEGIAVMYQKCPHLGCRVPNCDTSQWFECPCHGSQYNQAGEKKAGPAPRGMDRFSTAVSGGKLSVDTGLVIQGPPIGTNTTGQEAEGPHCVTGAGGH